MKKQFKGLVVALILVALSTIVNAQPYWNTVGNVGTTGNILGTTNNWNLNLVAGNGGPTRMTIRANNGRVGIGITNPTNKLEVFATDPEDGIRVTQNGGVNGNGAAGLHLKNNTPGGILWSFYSLGSGNTVQGTGNFLLQSNDGVNSVARLLINKTTGNVGIGTLTPAEKLEVFGGDARINSLTVGLGAGFISSNTVLGASALKSNTSGYNNSAVGFQSLFSNTFGNNNTAYGYSALQNNTYGSANTAAGASALQNNTTGFNNVAYGVNALIANSTGSNNSANGVNALGANSSGDDNTATGSSALGFNTLGSGNTASGFNTLGYNTTGSYNTADGLDALLHNASGSGNTANGTFALASNISGGANTAAGDGALYTNTTGSNNTSIGYGSDVSVNNLTNATAIGAGAIVNLSNKIRLGNVLTTVIEGQVAYTWPSDGRFKKNIKEDVPGLEFINKLRPVTYNFETEKFDDFIHKNDKKFLVQKKSADYTASKNVIQTGFVAQEVEKTMKEIGYNFNGVHHPENEDDNYGISYDLMVVPLVKSVQELSKQNDSMQNENLQLKSTVTDLQKQFNDLKAVILTMQQRSPDNTATAQTNNITITDEAALEQNVPNPFTNTTSIGYTLPEKFTTAQIMITDKNGKTLKLANVSGTGKGRLNVDAAILASGAYNYSLIINGKLIGSKQMVLAK